MRTQSITIPADGLHLAGDLRLPDDAAPAGLPGIVFTGPFTGVKEQVVATYARALTEAGFATLAFDHRNFGASEGTPRQHEDAAGKLADLRAALSRLGAEPGVDANRLGACGICLGGGYALRFAAFDPRVRALAVIAGGYNNPSDMRRGMGADAYREQMTRLAEVAARQDVGGPVEYMAAVAPAGEPAVMGGQEPFDYYGTDRSASPGWVNQITALSVRELLTFDAAIGADFISPTPMLVVHGKTDLYCSPEGAQSVYDRAGEPKEIVWLDTSNHVDLYDNPEFVRSAVARTIDWFRQYL